MKKKMGIIILYIALIAITIIIAAKSICYIYNDENINNAVIFEALPIYLGIASFFTKYLIDVFKEENENKKYWYRNYILETYIKRFNCFIDKTKELFSRTINMKSATIKDDLNLSEHKKRLEEDCEAIADKYTLLWSEHVSSLEFIKIYDANLYKKLNDIFEKLQDDFMYMLDQEKATTEVNKSDNFIMKLEENRNSLLKELYEYSIE